MNLKKYRLCMILLAITLISFNTISLAYVEKNQTLTENINTQIYLNNDEFEVLNLINKIRKENGLSELKINMELQNIAERKAIDIVTNEYFSHTSPTYGSPFDMMKTYNIKYKIAGENLAGNITSEKAVEAWMNSKLHKDNILDNRFEYTAICVVNSEIYGKVFVQMFLGI